MSLLTKNISWVVVSVLFRIAVFIAMFTRCEQFSLQWNC